jgi:hypothetical protein
MNKTLLLASVLAAFVTVVHIFAGGKDVASPLLASALADEARLTLYAVWHMVSALLGISALVLARAALPQHQVRMAPAVRLVALLWLASGLVFLAVAATQPGEGLFLKLPQWILLLPVGVLAWLGANSSSKPTPLRGAA